MMTTTWKDAVGVNVHGGNVAAPPPAIDNSSNPVDNPLVVVPPPTPAEAAQGFGLTPRPYIGKKRAKQLAQQAAAIKLKKTKKDDPPEPGKVFYFNQVLKYCQNKLLERLAFAAEVKANVAKEQYMFNFHMKNPPSAALNARFAAKELKYAPAVPTATAATGTSGDDDVDPTDDPADDAKDDKESYIDEDGRSVPGGHVRDIALDNIIAAHYAGPPNTIGLDKATDTTSHDSQEEG
jgi:hypothetical protein